MILSVLMEEVEFGSAMFISVTVMLEFSRICNHCTEKKKLIQDEQHNIFCLSCVAVLLLLIVDD